MTGTQAIPASPGSSERGETSGSGPIMPPYPHDDNGASGWTGPVNRPGLEQYQGEPVVTRQADEAGQPNITHSLAEQVSVRDTQGEVQVP